ncbi:MAG TPA: fibronectin type III domain-containing protein [Blastocatellia bacterium]|nr:fibronectin type III domain-containing protein [Blastocatellia bacterium]
MRRNALSIWVIITVIIFQQGAVARFAAPAARRNNSESTSPALPGSGSIFEDSDREAKIVRVTDNRDAQAAAVSSLSGPSFNADSSRFLISLDGVATLYSFDTSRLKIQKEGPLFDRATPDGNGAQWSASEPEMIMALEAAADTVRIQAYDLRARAFSTVKDFSGALPEGEARGLSKSCNDDDRFAFTWREAGAASWHYVIVWDRPSDKTYFYDITDPATGVAGFFAARLDRSGEALIINGDVDRVWRYRDQPQSESTQLDRKPDGADATAAVAQSRSHEDDSYDLMGFINRRSDEADGRPALPRSNISPDGRFSIFNSRLNSPRSDVFIATLGAQAASTSSVIWTHLVNCSANENTVQKTSGADEADDARATSVQSITSGDGQVEFTASETGKERFCGLNNSNDIHQSADDINFAIRLSDKKAMVSENGKVKAKTKYKAGNVFRIAVESGVVNYYKNGSVFYTSGARPAYPLLVNASLINAMSSVSNVMIYGAGTGTVISISPVKASVRAGDTIQFTAIITGAKNENINWSATGGVVSNAGLYSAPSVAGTYIVKATAASDASISASALVVVTGGADTVPPVITAVASSGVTASAATITWTTNEPGDTQVEYGATTAYGSLTALNSSAVTGHSAGLSGLAASTTYHYRVRSKDAAGNLAASGDFSFTTGALAPPPPGGGGGVKTDYGVYPEPPPPALPRAGGTFVDPVFGTTIMRVTDENDGAFNATNYSYWPSFNKDSTRLYIVAGGQTALYSFDPVNFRISNKRRLFLSNPPTGGVPDAEDAIWSGVDPNVILGHDGLKIWAYNVATNTYSLVKDFTGELPAGYISQMSRSIDDNVFGFTLKNASGGLVGYAAWRRSNNSIYRVDTRNLDEVQVDKTGQYLVVKQDPASASGVEVRVVNLLTRSVEDLTDSSPDYAPGHSDNGAGLVVGGDNWANRFTVRRLSSPHEARTVVGFGSDWSLGSHVSMLADGDEWALVSTFVANGLESRGVFRNELFVAAVDGSGRVRRLAHTHSEYRGYWDSPRANISRDGRYAVFTSNWGRADRRDVFICKIPLAGAEARPGLATSAITARRPTGPANNGGARENVVWVNILRSVAATNSLQKITGRDDAPDAGARSRQSITSGDAWVEFTAAETDKTRYCGLSRSAAGTDFASIDFAIKLTGSGVAEVRESGSYAAETTYQSGDSFRIAIEAGRVNYYKNGSLFYTSLNAPAYPLIVKASLVNLNARVSNVIVSTTPAARPSI